MILTGWKEISNHLRYGIRTVQRWERDGLPVKRVTTSPHSPVVADSEELDAWILHRIELPPEAPRKVADNLRRARELRSKAQEIRKELRGYIGCSQEDVRGVSGEVTKMIHRAESNSH